jgi:alcohol dehydrogenase/L-iditol 2-dehydrogenase
MPAVVNYAAEPGSVELREVPIPEIGETDVLLRVQAVSVCGSDLHQWLGGASWYVNYPCVLGHEFGGTVAEVGSRIRNVKPGDRVVSETAAVIDEASPFSRSGLYNLDPRRLGFGYGVDGAMATYVKVPERTLHLIPDNLEFEKAALTEPCCVAYNAVCANADVRPGDSVLVLGPGPIGLLCALMAKLSGAGTLIVSGLPSDRARLDIAKQLGADVILEGNDVVEQVKDLTGGYGAEVVIDAAGVSPTFLVAINAVRPNGQVIKVGWGPQPLNFSLDAMVQKAVTVKGSFSHNWPIWNRVISMMTSGQLDVTPLISNIAPLDAWEENFNAMHDKSIVKAVLRPPDI